MILEDLDWLGITWDGPVRRQSDHMADYADALARLKARNVLYPCFCSRREIRAEIAASPSAPHGPDGPLYPGTCRGLDPTERLARGDAHAWRLDVQKALDLTGAELTWIDDLNGEQIADPAVHGDVVLARKDIATSYHLAVTVDDASQGVTLITRGEDLLEATHVHRLLQALLDLPTPIYRHHRLIRNSAGRRLASRDGAKSLQSYRDQGISPAMLKEMISS